MTEVEPRWKQPAPKAKRRKPLPSYSPKRFSEKELRAEVVRQVLERDQHRCRARLIVPSVECGGPLDVHERIPRSAWAKGYLVRWNCLALCRNHHRWVDGNVDHAHRLGLHGYSWEVEHTGRTGSWQCSECSAPQSGAVEGHWFNERSTRLCGGCAREVRDHWKGYPSE